jgi:hypothetical protein
MWVAATLAAAGGMLSYLTIRDDSVAAGMSATSAPNPARYLSCPLNAPPFRGLQRRGNVARTSSVAFGGCAGPQSPKSTRLTFVVEVV